MINFNLDLADLKKGPPLMTGDLGWDEYAGTVSPLGLANLAPIEKAEIGTFRYIRIHNIFTGKEGDGRGERDAGGQPVREDKNGNFYYDWSIIDKVLETILKINCIPFLELGFTPTQWSSKPEGEDIELRDEVTSQDKYKNPPCQYPPKDYKLWEDLVDKFLSHIYEIYGEQMQQWPIELWNEPNISYFRGTKEQYFELWKITYDICKKHKMVAVGGPGTARPTPFITDYLLYSVKNNCKPDFISYHVKGGSAASKFSNIALIWADLLEGRDLIYQIDEFKDTPIFITEIDPMVGCELGIQDNPKWEWRNTSYYASWLGKVCYLFASMQRGWPYEESEPDEEVGPFYCDAQFNDAHHITGERTTFYGARCLTTPFWINKAGEIELTALEKPIFRAFEYVKYLRGEYIPFINNSSDVFGVVAKNGNELNICIVLHKDKLENSQNTWCKIKIDNIKSSNPTLVESISIDKNSANPYDLWKSIGSPQQVTEEQWITLKEESKVKNKAIEKLDITTDSIKFEIEMVDHSFNFIRFKLD